MTVKLTKNDIDGVRAWIVLLAVCCGRLIVSTSLYMSGVFYVALLEHFRGSQTKTSVIGSLNYGLLCLLGPFVSVFIDCTSCRTSIVSGGLLLSLIFLVSSFIDDINYLIFTLGVCGGIANSMISTPFSVTLSYYFSTRRNLVIALSISFVGLGMFIASPLSVFLLDNYGLKGTFIFVGAFNAHICVCGVLCKPASEEIAIQMQKKDKRKGDATAPKQRYKFNVINNVREFLKCCNLGIFKNVPFVLFLLSTATWNFTESVCLLHLPNYVTSKDFPDSSVAILMTIYGVSNTVGRFLAALTAGPSTGFDTLKVHIVTLGVAGVVNLTFHLYSHFDNAVYIYAACSALFTGFPNSIISTITIRLVGLRDFSTGHGLELLFCGIGILTGPPLAGYLHETTESYESSFVLSGSVILAGSFLAVVSLLLSPTNATDGTGSDVSLQPDKVTKAGKTSESDDRLPGKLNI